MFTRYIPEDALPNVFYLKDDKTGNDWYEVLKTYNLDDLKIAVHGVTNDIVYSFYDGSKIFPDNCNVVVPKNIPEEFFSSPHGWKYIKSKFVHVKDTDEYKQVQKENEIELLTVEYNKLKLKSDLGIINLDEQTRLTDIHEMLIKFLS